MAPKTKAFRVSRELVGHAVLDSVRKLDPREQWNNLVIFVVYFGAILTTINLLWTFTAFSLQVVLWLWFTVLFANFAESIAEGRGKAQAEALRKMRVATQARLWRDGKESKVTAAELRVGDQVICETGDVIPGDGEVVQGIASVDESAITGESAPVIREAGGDRSAVTGGTRVLSDRIVVRISSEPGKTFLDRMIALVEGAARQKTPNELALEVLLVSLTVLFLLVVITLPAMAWHIENEANQPGAAGMNLFVLTALLVCLIPTTIGGLLSAIGISGMDRLVQRNVLATSGRAVEAAGDIDVLLLDKTGTVTLGNRMATEFISAPGIAPARLADVAQLASLADETPEGRSIVVLAKEQFALRGRELGAAHANFVPFSAKTQMSGVDFPENGKMRQIRKGSAQAIRLHVEGLGASLPAAVRSSVEAIARQGGTPLVVAEGAQVLGVVHLKDVVKGGIKERFAELRGMGIKTVMITGDNPLTAAAIAAEAGVDDFMAQAKPEDKLARIRQEQELGHLVAMTGDGTN
ncbi:MAG TPA: potassium-transporting ATPase subunit KdpB, partial [Candidatus Limnocylindria bacterium]|nr:potassium-transporting ATPase subunit KdpB [Candidatus Limnocylindria bacterium]